MKTDNMRIIMKITFLGGGSTYIPIIIQELINCEFSLDEIVFVDKVWDGMEVIAHYCQKIIGNEKTEVTLLKDINEKIQGSDVIISIFRSRGGEGRKIDENLGKEYGILGQETQGIGGFSSALRNIQVLSEFAPKIKEYCPNALFLNITNPSGILTYAANFFGLNAVGICDAPYAMKKNIANFLHVEKQQLSIKYFGLNHLGWITDIRMNNVSIMDELIHREDFGELLKYLKQINIPIPIRELDFIKSIKAIPSSYLVYYYQTSEVIEYLSKKSKTRAEEVQATNEKIFNTFKRGDISQWPNFFISARGGYLLGDVIANFFQSYFSEIERETIICIKNGDCFPKLPHDAIIEVSANVKGKEIQAIYQNLSPHIQSLVRLISDYEVLTAEAALQGNIDKAMQALTIHPLIREIDTASILLDKILAIYADELPQFAMCESRRKKI